MPRKRDLRQLARYGCSTVEVGNVFNNSTDMSDNHIALDRASFRREITVIFEQEPMAGEGLSFRREAVIFSIGSRRVCADTCIRAGIVHARAQYGLVAQSLGEADFAGATAFRVFVGGDLGAVGLPEIQHGIDLSVRDVYFRGGGLEFCAVGVTSLLGRDQHDYALRQQMENETRGGNFRRDRVRGKGDWCFRARRRCSR